VRLVQNQPRRSARREREQARSAQRRCHLLMVFFTSRSTRRAGCKPQRGRRGLRAFCSKCALHSGESWSRCSSRQARMRPCPFGTSLQNFVTSAAQAPRAAPFRAAARCAVHSGESSLRWLSKQSRIRPLPGSTPAQNFSISVAQALNRGPRGRASASIFWQSSESSLRCVSRQRRIRPFPGDTSWQNFATSAAHACGGAARPVAAKKQTAVPAKTARTFRVCIMILPPFVPTAGCAARVKSCSDESPDANYGGLRRRTRTIHSRKYWIGDPDRACEIAGP